jgi:hypothetical protein
LAKAGYDPRVAIDVWQRMADLEKVIGDEVAKKEEPVVVKRAVQTAKRSIPSIESSSTSEEEKYQDLQYGVREFLDALVNSWFGSSHPPNIERIEYMRENMDEAILLYNDALKLNGPPIQFIFSEDLMLQQQQQQQQDEMQLTTLVSFGIFGRIGHWLSSVYAWNSGNNERSSGNNGSSNGNLVTPKSIT